MRLRRLASLLLACALASAAPAAPVPHVYLVIVDGLDARFATPARMPRLFALVADNAERSTVFRAARAVMPTRTNSNHASLLTGVHPAAHGITGNAWWSRLPEALPEKLDAGEQLQVQTLFTVAETTARDTVTFGAFAKPKLVRLFAGVPDRQIAPDMLWSPGWLPSRARDATTGYSFDADTMTAALAHMAKDEPDLAVITLADVDRTAHGRGPDTPDTERAVLGADQAIGRLAGHLRELGRWGRSVLIVTADHGFTSVAPSAERPYPVLTFGRDVARAGIRGIRLVADGGVEHVYAEDLAPGATPSATTLDVLARVAALARETPGIAEVLARVPVPGVPTLAEAHPDWHLDHERTGELLLVAARGHQFVDPYDPVDAGLLGNHGGPEDVEVPLVVTGGSPAITAAPPGTPMPSAVDVAPTIAALLHLPPPRRLDGATLTPGVSGRPIVAVLSADDAQSPH
jgi:hypothetical protein